MDFDNSFFVLLMLTGGIFIIASIVMIVFPPRKINHLYGYRTPASMKSDDRWHFAQKFSASAMFQSGLGLIVISLLGAFAPFSEMTNMTSGMVVFIIAIVIMIYRTEKALKSKFPTINP